MITFNQLCDDFRLLGIQKGDILFLRISCRAIGKIDGGPKTVIDALLNVIGTEGTIVVTVFPKRYNSKLRFFIKNDCFDKKNEVTTGAIPTAVLSYSDVVVSNHPVLPFAILGAKAKELINKDDTIIEDYDVFRKMTQLNGKCLRIGGEALNGTTHLALTDFLIETGCYQLRESTGRYYIDNRNRKLWYSKLPSMFCVKGFSRFYHENLYKKIILSSAKVGNGDAFLTDMQASFLAEKQALLDSPKAFFCDDPDCFCCRVSYNYSDTNLWVYIFRQFKNLFTKSRIDAAKLIYRCIRIILSPERCQ